MVQIYTKKGDMGLTSLLGGTVVAKDHMRVEAYGSIDEASSALSMAVNLTASDDLKNISRRIMKDLFIISAELAGNNQPAGTIPLDEEHVSWLEKNIDRLEALRPPQRGFVYPGATLASGAFDLARTIVRRAERRTISLAAAEYVNPIILKYLNRLSDMIYVMARVEEFNTLVDIITREVFRQMADDNGYVDKGLLGIAKKLAEASEQHAKKIGVPMVISVVDTGGNLVLSHRMDDALLVSIDIAANKAFTAVGVKLPTHKLTDLSQPGGALYGIQNTNNNRIVIFGGGYPLYSNGVLIGGLGISGGSVEEDMEVAEAAIKAVCPQN